MLCDWYDRLATQSLPPTPRELARVVVMGDGVQDDGVRHVSYNNFNQPSGQPSHLPQRTRSDTGLLVPSDGDRRFSVDLWVFVRHIGRLSAKRAAGRARAPKPPQPFERVAAFPTAHTRVRAPFPLRLQEPPLGSTSSFPRSTGGGWHAVRIQECRLPAPRFRDGDVGCPPSRVIRLAGGGPHLSPNQRSQLVRQAAYQQQSEVQ